MANNFNGVVNRNNMFYSENDYQYETDLMLNYLEEDLNQSVVIYEVDRRRTNLNSTYMETKGKVFYKPPKEIPCLYEISDSELKSYDQNTMNGVYSVSGKLTVYVLDKALEKYKCTVSRGDYIGVLVEPKRMVFFSVVDDGKVNTSNKFVLGGYRTAWREIKAAPCTLEEFSGK